MVKKSSEDPESSDQNLPQIIEELASTQQNQQLAEQIHELNKQLEEAASKMKACDICYTPWNERAIALKNCGHKMCTNAQKKC